MRWEVTVKDALSKGWGSLKNFSKHNLKGGVKVEIVRRGKRS